VLVSWACLATYELSQGQYLSPTLTWDVRLQVEWLASTLYPHLTRVCDTGSDVEPMVFCHNDLQEGNWIVKPDGSFKVRDRLLKDQPLVSKCVLSEPAHANVEGTCLTTVSCNATDYRL